MTAPKLLWKSIPQVFAMICSFYCHANVTPLSEFCLKLLFNFYTKQELISNELEKTWYQSDCSGDNG